jgi:hypothetical protein
MKVRVIPEKPPQNAREQLPDLSRGEKLMLAYDLYLKKVADHQINLERAILLVFELADEDRSLYLRRCTTCPLFMLVETVGPQRSQCAECRDRRSRLAPDRPLASGTVSPVGFTEDPA